MHNLPILEVKTSLSGGASRGADTDIVAVYSDGAKKAIPPKGPYSATVAKLRKLDAFAARNGSVEFIRFGGKGGLSNALLVGLGPVVDLKAAGVLGAEEKLRAAGGHAWQRLVAEKSKGAVVRADLIASVSGVGGIRAFAEGLVLGAYKFEKHKTQKKNPKEQSHGPARVSLVIPQAAKDKKLKADLDREIAEVNAAAAAIQVTRDWSNEPSNHGTPEYFAAEAKRLAKEYGLKCTVLTEKDAEREKMGLFLGVGQGAEREGRIVVLEYNPPKANADARTIAFVGKGITFDSGGISIKPSMRMEEMKHDMTGAATMMGATLLAAKMKVPNRVVTILGFTENMPDGNAIQPGNVIASRSGKTVEVINTDAEGRLILADLLDYIQDFKPDAIIDAATLTGAVAIALGKLCCGIMGNDQALIDAIRASADATGERTWQLPLFDEYFEDMRSDTADMRNSANDSYGGTIRGAIFLKQFIKKGFKWAHLDIAATAWGVSHLPYMPKRGASGSYVRALARFAADFR